MCYANKTKRMIFTTAGLMAVLVSFGYPCSRSLGEDLSTQIYVPASGHIELQVAALVRISGLEVNGIEDIIKMQNTLNQTIGLSSDSIISFQFLETLGLKEIPRKLPTSTANPKRKYFLLPRWTDTIIDFDGSTSGIVQKLGLDGGIKKDTITGKASDVVLDSRKVNGKIRPPFYVHKEKSPISPLSLNQGLLYSRSKSTLSLDYKRVKDSEIPLFSFPLGSSGYERFLLLDDRHNTVLLKATVNAKQRHVMSFTLHAFTSLTVSPEENLLPFFTCVFYRLGEEWGMNCYLISKSELDIPISSERFLVNVPAGAQYTSRDKNGNSFAVRVKTEIKDLTSKTPAEVQKELSAVQ